MGSDATAPDDERFFFSSFGQRPRVSHHFGIPRRFLSKTKLLACLTFLILIAGSAYVASYDSTDTDATDLLDTQFQIALPPTSHTTKAAIDFKHDDALKLPPKSQVPGIEFHEVVEDLAAKDDLTAKDDTAVKDDTAAAKDDTAIAKDDTAIAKDDTAVAKDDTAVAKDDTAVAKDDTAIAKDDTAVAMDDTAVAKDDTTVAKDDIAVAKDDTAVAKDDTAVAKDDTAVAKDDTAVAKDDTTVAKDDTTVAKDDTVVEKDDTVVEKDDTAAAKDNMAAIKQEKFPAAKENAVVVVRPDDLAVKPIASTSSSVSIPVLTVKPTAEEWKDPSEEVIEAKPKPALKPPKAQPNSKQQAAGAKDKGKPLGTKVSIAVEPIICQDYIIYSRQQHLPLSGGPLNLPSQRPPAKCRRFESPAIEEVIKELGNKILDLDLAQMFRNCLPNTLDTTIAWFNNDTELPYSFVVTGDIPAMWLRDSTNQVLPYVAYAHKDPILQTLLRGVILLQARYVDHNPYANAFKAPAESGVFNGGWSSDQVYPPIDRSQVSEAKYEIDSLAAFLKISYQYWAQTHDLSFVRQGAWLAAAEKAVHTMRDQQQGTFDEQGAVHAPHYNFTRFGQSPTDTQFLGGNGQPVRYTGMVKSHFRPSDDSSVFPFFVPGNAMAAVELEHLAELLEAAKAAPALAQEAKALAGEIKEAIYKYAVVKHPQYGEMFAFEVDGYGSSLLMDDANIPSLLSLPYLGFVDVNDPIYQNTRKFVLSEANPYFFKGPLGSGVGGPHVGLKMAWPMSQTMRILTSQSDDEILDALKIIVSTTDGTGLMHEAFSVFDKQVYSRPWFAWSNTLFGEAILEIASKRPSLLFEKKLDLEL